MKLSDCIRLHWDLIAATMVDRYRKVLESDGRIQYTIYLWEDGEIEALQDVQGGNTWLEPRQGDPRKLFTIATVRYPFFDFRDYLDSQTDGEADLDDVRQEVINELVSEYADSVDDTLNDVIRDAERE